MDGRGAGPGAQGSKPGDQVPARVVRARSVGHEETRAADGCERHRHLELRVVAAARAAIGLRPRVVEHVFALRVGFEVARGRGEEPPRLVLHEDMDRRPTRGTPYASRVLKSRKKGIRNERVERIVVPADAWVGARVPGSGGDLGK